MDQETQSELLLKAMVPTKTLTLTEGSKQWETETTSRLVSKILILSSQMRMDTLKEKSVIFTVKETMENSILGLELLTLITMEEQSALQLEILGFKEMEIVSILLSKILILSSQMKVDTKILQPVIL